MYDKRSQNEIRDQEIYHSRIVVPRKRFKGEDYLEIIIDFDKDEYILRKKEN